MPSSYPRRSKKLIPSTVESSLELLNGTLDLITKTARRDWNNLHPSERRGIKASGGGQVSWFQLRHIELATELNETIARLGKREVGYAFYDLSKQWSVVPWTKIRNVILHHPVTGKPERCRRYELFPIQKGWGFMDAAGDIGRKYIVDVNLEPDRQWDEHSSIV